MKAHYNTKVPIQTVCPPELADIDDPTFIEFYKYCVSFHVTDTMREMRNGRGLSQGDLANACATLLDKAFSASDIDRIENRKCKARTIEIAAISKTLNIAPILIIQV